MVNARKLVDYRAFDYRKFTHCYIAVFELTQVKPFFYKRPYESFHLFGRAVGQSTRSRFRMRAAILDSGTGPE